LCIHRILFYLGLLNQEARRTLINHRDFSTVIHLFTSFLQMYSVCVSAVDISCNPFLLLPRDLLRVNAFFSGTSIDSDHLRFHPDEIKVVAATSVAGALVLEFVFRAQTTAINVRTHRLGFKEGGSMDALVAIHTNLAHSPNVVALEHPGPSADRLRSDRVRVRAVLHPWNGR